MSNAATTGKVGIVFLHGSGSNGRDLKSFLSIVAMKEFNFQSFTEVCDSRRWHLCTPTAPIRHYSADGGEERNVWFDRSHEWHDKGLEEEHEDIEGVDESVRQVLSAVKVLCTQHREIEHVFVGGFSMGGACSLHLLRNFFNTNALETNRNLPILKKIKGIFVFSSFLVQSSVVFKGFQTANFELARTVFPLPQVFMGHGDSDAMVPEAWGSATAAMLMQYGVDIQMNIYKGVEHEFTMQELQDLVDWMRFVMDADIKKQEAESKVINRYDGSNDSGARDSKMDSLSRDMKSSGLSYSGHGSDSGSDGEEDDRHSSDNSNNSNKVNTDESLSLSARLVRTAELGDKQHYYAQEQQLAQTRDRAVFEADEKNSGPVGSTSAGASADYKASGKGKTLTASPAAASSASNSSNSNSSSSAAVASSSSESLIPYEIEYLSSTRSAFANQVRIIFTVPTTTSSDIDM